MREKRLTAIIPIFAGSRNPTRDLKEYLDQ
jgi:hypothetical protein